MHTIKFSAGTSVRSKLFISNLMMIIIPILILLVSVLIFWGLFRFTNPISQRNWVMLMPSTIAQEVIQFSIGRIYKIQNDHDEELSDLRDITCLLEVQGIDVLITKKGEIVYNTPEMDLEQTMQTIENEDASLESLQHRLVWEKGNFFFVSQEKKGYSVIALGSIPFLSKNTEPETVNKIMIETFFGIGIIIFIILVVSLGIYIARYLSQSILLPLQSLRGAAAEIKKGNFDITLPILSNDELGETSHTFNLMSKELLLNQQQRLTYEKKRQEMIAGLCHDIATPLTSVKGYASGILEGIANTPEKREHYVRMIYDMSIQMESLVRMLSNFSRLELGTISYNYQKVNLEDFFTTFLYEKGQTYREEKLFLSFTNKSTENDVYIDAEQFGRVIMNILSNSSKYRKNDKAHVNIEMYNNNSQVIINLIDDGIGVELENIDKIFDIFYRTDKARTEVHLGSGIGLAVVKQIVEDFQGTIRAQRNNQGGLTIKITLPNSKGV